jgi:hypothetical protein
MGLRIADPHRTASGLLAPDDTVLLDLSRLRNVDIDALAWRARIEADAHGADVVGAAAEHALVVLGASSRDVGLVGHTQSGGIGWLARSLGLAVNGVTAIEVVTADGALVWADHETEPDLFWAARGGGGCFGFAMGAGYQAERAATVGRAEVARLFDIGGGRQMYLRCSGNGSPTVVLVSGAGGAHVEWTQVMDGPDAEPRPAATAVFPQLARSGRVCAYDRPDTTLMNGADALSTPVPPADDRAGGR